jgi:hypothetical protein
MRVCVYVRVRQRELSKLLPNDVWISVFPVVMLLMLLVVMVVRKFRHLVRSWGTRGRMPTVKLAIRIVVNIRSNTFGPCVRWLTRQLLLTIWRILLLLLWNNRTPRGRRRWCLSGNFHLRIRPHCHRIRGRRRLLRRIVVQLDLWSMGGRSKRKRIFIFMPLHLLLRKARCRSRTRDRNMMKRRWCESRS